VEQSLLSTQYWQVGHGARLRHEITLSLIFILCSASSAVMRVTICHSFRVGALLPVVTVNSVWILKGQNGMDKCTGRSSAMFIPSVLWMWPRPGDDEYSWNRTEVIVYTEEKNYTAYDLPQMLTVRCALLICLLCSLPLASRKGLGQIARLLSHGRQRACALISCHSRATPSLTVASMNSTNQILQDMGLPKVRSAFSDSNLLSRMSWVPTPARSKSSEQACDQWHSSRVFTPLTGWHCKLRPNTEGLDLRRPGTTLLTINSVATLRPNTEGTETVRIRSDGFVG
jgi:hypothetical protein